MISGLIIIAIFILIGTMFSFGKWSFLIAGFNTMSKEEKENYDVLALCKFMGKFMFIIAFCISLFLLNEILTMKILLYIGITLFIASTIFVTIYSNTGDRFKKKK